MAMGANLKLLTECGFLSLFSEILQMCAVGFDLHIVLCVTSDIQIFSVDQAQKNRNFTWAQRLNLVSNKSFL
jgi:hypothetical protein